MYKWNPKANRYQWFNGSARFVSRETVMAWVDKSLAATGATSDMLGSMAYNGEIAPRDWAERMRTQIKDEIVRQYITGIGGRQNMTQSDWGRVGTIIKDQYKYFRGFAAQVAEGTLTEGQIQARSRMYINSAREAFEKATKKVAKKWGAAEVYWDVDASVENCPGCLNYSALGWVPVDADAYEGNYPGSGSTQCLTNCHCSLKYRNADGVEYMA